MANRVESADVKVIVETSIADVTTFIDTAHLVVDTHLLPLGSLSEDLLTQIEKYLAAHFVALTEERGGLVRSSFGNAAETLSDIYGQGFQSTRFGQQALALDSTGTLIRVSSPKQRAEIKLVGYGE